MDGCGGFFWVVWMDGCWRGVEGREIGGCCKVGGMGSWLWYWMVGFGVGMIWLLVLLLLLLLRVGIVRFIILMYSYYQSA